MVCYVAPTDLGTIKQVIKAIDQCPNRSKILVFGDLNMYIGDPEGNSRDKIIAAVISNLGLEDMLAHLLPCQYLQWARYGRTCIMVQL